MLEEECESGFSAERILGALLRATRPKSHLFREKGQKKDTTPNHIATVSDICMGFKNNCLPETKIQIANKILRDRLLFGIWMLKATF